MKTPSLKHVSAIFLLCTVLLIGCRRNLGQDIPGYNGSGSENSIVLPQSGESAGEGEAQVEEPVLVDPATLDTTSGGDQPLENPGEASAETQPAEETVVEEAVNNTETEAAAGEADASAETATTTETEAESPAPEPAPADVSTEQATIIHVVQQGDTIGRIAEQYGVSIDDILVANDLFNVNLISIGQELTVEAGAAANAPAPAAAQPAQQTGSQFDPNNYFIHIVGFGDTLFVIGQRYGFTVEELASYNGLFDINRIDLNQEIRIPNR